MSRGLAMSDDDDRVLATLKAHQLGDPTMRFYCGRADPHVDIPTCSCGESMYPWEHPRHVRDALREADNV